MSSFKLTAPVKICSHNTHLHSLASWQTKIRGMWEKKKSFSAPHIMGSYLESHLCPVCWKMGNSYGMWHQKPSCSQHKYFSEIQRYAIFSWWTFPFTVVYNTAGFYDKSKYYSVLGCKTFTFIRVNKSGGNVGNKLPGNLFSQWVNKVTKKKEKRRKI